jgi:hypothetical protein
MANDSNDNQEQTIATQVAEFLEGAFESVALTRREHFEKQPDRRPSPQDIASIISSAANFNGVIAAGANMVPGPLGALTIVPELTAIIRNQIQMIYDIGVAHGKEAHLNGNLLLSIFYTVTGGGAISLATVKGGQLLLKRASLGVIQRIIIWLGGKITQRALKALLARWVPIAGSVAMGIWARQSTVSMGKKAAEFLAREIIVED